MDSRRNALFAATASFVVGGAIVAAFLYTIMGADTNMMGECPNGVDPTNKVTHVVRVVIPEGWDPSVPARNVRVKEVGQYNRAVDDDNDSGGEIAYDGGTTKPFHVDFQSITQNSDAKFIEVRVVLRDNGEFDFAKMDDNSGEIYGVGKSRPNGDIRLCKSRVEKTTAGKPVAIFYARTKRNQNKPPELNGYNILLKPLADPDTPVIIDPKIRNNG